MQRLQRSSRFRDFFQFGEYCHDLPHSLVFFRRHVLKPCVLRAAINGANYLDRDTRLLYITIRGPDPVDVKTVPLVVLKFGLPPITIDDFFEENLIQNLATWVSRHSKCGYVSFIRLPTCRQTIYKPTPCLARTGTVKENWKNFVLLIWHTLLEKS